MIDVLAQRPCPFGAPIILFWPPSDLRTPAIPSNFCLALISGDSEPITPAIVKALNRDVAGVLAASTTEARALTALGLRVPLRVIGHGIDIADGVPHGQERLAATRLGSDSEDKIAEPFIALHKSSCSTKAGIDILLTAWARAFDETDLVRLILLHPADQRDAIFEQLDALGLGEITSVELVIDEMPQRSSVVLLQRSYCVVLPTRDENCSRGAAEAMASGVPLIITGQGAHCDFLAADAARLLDYRVVACEQGVLKTPAIEPCLDDLIAHCGKLSTIIGREVREPGTTPGLRSPAPWRSSTFQPGLTGSRLPRANCL